jgi:hypothetical protein
VRVVAVYGAVGGIVLRVELCKQAGGGVAACKLSVGIDVGKGFHHACAVDETGKVVFSRKVANEQHSIEQLIARICGKAPEIVRWL